MGAVPLSHPSRSGPRVLARQIRLGLALGAVLALGGMSWGDAKAAPSKRPAKSDAKAAAKATPAGATASGTPMTATQARSRPATVQPGARAAQHAPTTLKVTVQAAPQEERVVYHYDALGRRDPFQSLIGGGFVGMDVGGDAPPDVGGIKVVGIVWGVSDKFAIAEDPRGNSMVLREGDKVMNGIVETLRRDAVVIKLNLDGVAQSITIPVTRKGEQNGN